MENSKISVTIGRTINMGNYESLKVQAGLEKSIKEDLTEDQRKEEYKNLWNEVNTEINRALEAFRK